MGGLEGQSDEELAQSYRRSRDPVERDELFQELFGRWDRRVAVWCYRFAGERDLAADLSQEVFLRVLKGLDGFQGGSKFSTWLYTIARNHCLNVASRRRPFETVNEDALAAVVDPTAMSPFDDVERQAEARELLDLMRDHLTDVECRVMILHYGHGIGLKPLTRLLNLTNTSGAKAAIVSSRRKLERVLGRRRARQERIRSQRQTAHPNRGIES